MNVSDVSPVEPLMVAGTVAVSSVVGGEVECPGTCRKCAAQLEGNQSIRTTVDSTLFKCDIGDCYSLRRTACHPEEDQN